MACRRPAGNERVEDKSHLPWCTLTKARVGTSTQEANSPPNATGEGRKGTDSQGLGVRLETFEFSASERLKVVLIEGNTACRRPAGNERVEDKSHLPWCTLTKARVGTSTQEAHSPPAPTGKKRMEVTHRSHILGHRKAERTVQPTMWIQDTTSITPQCHTSSSASLPMWRRVGDKWWAYVDPHRA